METVELEQIYDADTPETLDEALIEYEQPEITIKLQGFQVFVNNPHCLVDPHFAVEIERNTEDLLSTAADSFVINTVLEGFEQMARFLPIETLVTYQLYFFSQLQKALKSAEEHGFSQTTELNIISYLTVTEVFLDTIFETPDLAFADYEDYIRLGEGFFVLFTVAVQIFGEFEQELLRTIEQQSEQPTSAHAEVLISLFICLDDWTLKLLGFPFCNTAFADRFTEPVASELVFSLCDAHPLAHAGAELFSFPQFREYSDEFHFQLINVSSQSLLSAVLTSEGYAERLLQILYSSNLIYKNFDLAIGCCAMLGFSGFYEDYELLSDIIIYISKACSNNELSSVLATTYDLFLCQLEHFPTHNFGIKIAIKLSDYLHSSVCSEQQRRVLFRALGSRFLYEHIDDRTSKETYVYSCGCVVNSFEGRCLILDNVFLLAAVRLRLIHPEMLKNMKVSDKIREVYLAKGEINVDEAAEVMFNVLGDVEDLEQFFQEHLLDGL